MLRGESRWGMRGGRPGEPPHPPQGWAVPFVGSDNVMTPWWHWEGSFRPALVSPAHLSGTSCSPTTSRWKEKPHSLLTQAAVLLGSPSEQTPCCSAAIPVVLASQATMAMSPRPQIRLFWWWWAGRPGVPQFTGSQRLGHDWATELKWVQ